MKLFAVYLGGYIPGCHIEMHDIRFVLGEKIEDTYPELKKQWFGDDKNFHIDAYMELKHIDEYKISLSREKNTQDQKLFFVFMGAYDKNVFGELHETGFFVGQDVQEVKQRALNNLCKDDIMPHKDTLYDVDSIIEISQLGEYFIHLKYTGDSQELKPDWFGYNTDVSK